MVDDPTLLAHQAPDGPRLTPAAGRAGWDSPAPGLDWTVRELVSHRADAKLPVADLRTRTFRI